MKSIKKSIRLAAELFSPAMLFAAVMALQMFHPAETAKKLNPHKTGTAGKAICSSVHAGPPLNQEIGGAGN